MRIFGKKPSEIRKATVAGMIALATVAAFIATMATGFPAVAAWIAIVTTILNAGLAYLQRQDVINEINALDDST